MGCNGNRVIMDGGESWRLGIAGVGYFGGWCIVVVGYCGVGYCGGGQRWATEPRVLVSESITKL